MSSIPMTEFFPIHSGARKHCTPWVVSSRVVVVSLHVVVSLTVAVSLHAVVSLHA